MRNRNQETGTRNREISFNRNFVGVAVFPADLSAEGMKRESVVPSRINVKNGIV